MFNFTDTVRGVVTQGTETARELKRYDEMRDSFPGEHFLVLAAGAFLLWGASRRRRSLLVRMVLTAAGSAMVGRAAAGRGGVAKIAGLLARR